MADPADSDWVALVDLDGDGNLDDETPVRSYGVDHQTLRFRSDTDTAKLHRVTGGLTILPARNTVEFHIAGGAHGTHVAGIAAGWRLNGQDGFDGVAPGAQILSLKIGHNSLSGGATTTGSVKKALEFGARWSRDHGRPVVFNMSYGIGSETEGHSAIDVFVDDFLLQHPDLVFVTSAGNDGPGLSTVGTPGAGYFAFTTGALFPAELSRRLYGGDLARNEPFHFSSRGGELMKPTALAPGAASSSVPPYARGDAMWGTSMASPQAAGAMAALVGAAVAEDVPYTWALLKQAVRGTARPLPGYTVLDQGAGVIAIPEAFRALTGLSDRAGSPLLAYTVTADGPIPTGASPQAAFWRTGGVYPEPPRGVAVTVTPAFAAAAGPDAEDAFYRAFTLRSDAPWLTLDRDQTYLKGGESRTFTVRYDPDRLREPGLHVGRVLAYAKGLGGSKAPEWESWHTVIVPHAFDRDTGYDRAWSGEGLEAGEIRRFYLRPPAGASAMVLDLEVPEGKHGRVRLALYDPAGRRSGGGAGWADSEERSAASVTLAGADLVPGTWEAVVVADYRNTGASAWRLRARVDGIRADPDTLRAFRYPQGGSPAAEVTATAVLDRAFHGRGEGEIAGYLREGTIRVSGTDVWTRDFKMGPDLDRVDFHFEMPAPVYDTLTDCAVQVLDGTGKAVVNSGFGDRYLDIVLRNPHPESPDSGTYTLRVWAGFTAAEAETSWSFTLREAYRRVESVPVRVRHGKDARFDLWPDVPVELTLECDSPPRVAPDGMVDYGEIRLVDETESRVRLALPVRLPLR